LLTSHTQRDYLIQQQLQSASKALIPNILPLGKRDKGPKEDEEDDYSNRSVFSKVKGVVKTAFKKIDKKLIAHDDDSLPNNVAVFRDDAEGLPDLLVVFKDLKASNLFYLDTIHPPKPYIAIKYAGRLKRTTGRGTCTAASWIDEDIAFPVYLEPQDLYNGSLVIKVRGYRVPMLEDID